MYVLTEDATLVCKHELGRVNITTTQSLVTIGRRKVLVEKDPENRQIQGCPNVGATIKPCTHTLRVEQGESPSPTPPLASQQQKGKDYRQNHPIPQPFPLTSSL